ncbi:MAG: saccharopine dehydrogenase family protein [Bacteroidota bacterium]|jgi:short subunit dehydrogenase-like uncharacterized protein
MSNNTFLLYGANGYTARLMIRLAAEHGLKPVLAGRNEAVIRQLATDNGLDYRIASLDRPEEVDALLQGVEVVLHAAGPFMYTAKPMMEACLRNKVHYLDITGEITVFEMGKRFHQQALDAGILIMPGVGFDVVPTDCMALFVKNHLPDATRLELAFATLGGMLSHGTATTMAENLGGDGAERRDGKIVRRPIGERGKWIDFGVKNIFCMSIPWGDVSTAYSTTAIPNITTYTRASPGTFNMLRWQKMYNWILRLGPVKNFYKKKIKQQPAGPSDEMRAKAVSLIWAQGTNAAGKTFTARLQAPEGYTLTAITSLLITKKVLEGKVAPGYHTPAGLYGADLILEVPQTTRTVVAES